MYATDRGSVFMKDDADEHEPKEEQGSNQRYQDKILNLIGDDIIDEEASMRADTQLKDRFFITGQG